MDVQLVTGTTFKVRPTPATEIEQSGFFNDEDRAALATIVDRKATGKEPRVPGHPERAAELAFAVKLAYTCFENHASVNRFDEMQRRNQIFPRDLDLLVDKILFSA